MPEDEKKRLGVVSVEVKVKYEDGFTNTMTSPDMIIWQPTQMAIVSPGGRPPMAKTVSLDGLEKALQVLEKVREDVKATIPSKEEIDKAREEIASQTAAGAKKIMPVSKMPTPADLKA